MDITREYDEQGVKWIGGKRTWLTVTEYAKKYSIRRQTVLSKINRKVVKAKRQPHSNIWLIEDTN